MPEFASILSVKHSDRPLTREELVRAVRLNVAAEYEAVQLYQQLAESTSDMLARRVLQDIAREELVHAGEFLRLLHALEPSEQSAYDEGYLEVEEMMRQGPD